MVDPAPPIPAAGVAPKDTQTDFMPPAEGGSYTRNADGTLTRTEQPTKVPVFAPISSSPAAAAAAATDTKE